MAIGSNLIGLICNDSNFSRVNIYPIFSFFMGVAYVLTVVDYQTIKVISKEHLRVT